MATIGRERQLFTFETCVAMLIYPIRGLIRIEEKVERAAVWNMHHPVVFYNVGRLDVVVFMARKRS
jgi:hypothetical protein